MRLEVCAAALLLAASVSHAQLNPDDPDWREADAPPPPALKLEGLLGLDLPGSALRFGVDPASIAIGKDTVVRYVVVARSESGAVNGLYEGIKCSAGEYKVYARHVAGHWVPTKDAQWRSLHDQGASRHSLLIARNGACIGHGTNTSAGQVARDLRAGTDSKFRQETR